jgi:hypothetical protein
MNRASGGLGNAFCSIARKKDIEPPSRKERQVLFQILCALGVFAVKKLAAV